MSEFVGRAALCNSRIPLLEKYLSVCKDYLEIGTLFGGSAVLAGQHCSGDVYCIDPLDGYYRSGEPDPICGLIPDPGIVIGNWVAAGLDLERLHLRLVRTPPLPDDIPALVDAAYIDGDHTVEGCMADWLLLQDRVSKYIIFDDIDKPSVRHVFQVAAEAKDSGWELAESSVILGVLRRVDG